MLKITTFGESHGRAIGVIVDGCPPGVMFSTADIQAELDRRKPGQNRYVTQRREPDSIEMLSGVLPQGEQWITTGTPIAMMIENVDQRSKDYGDITQSFRPGHADWTYQAKYGLRDARGGGRSSARETAMRVAAGALARKIIPQVRIRAALVQMGAVKVRRENWDWSVVNANPFFCPDPDAAGIMASYLEDIRKQGSSVGALIEVEADGVPAGWGAPLYGKLDADLAAAMMGINAVKGVEIGEGFAVAAMKGEDNADEMRAGEQAPTFLSNHAGGILGGISTGQPIVLRVAIKPTSSILVPRQTVTTAGDNTDIVTKGRHDPCVGIRAVPVVEAMMACVLADHFLLHRGQTGRDGAYPFPLST